jgi:hypothetical protein
MARTGVENALARGLPAGASEECRAQALRGLRR